MASTSGKLVRMKADTFRATLRLGLGFKGPVHVPEALKVRDSGIEELCEALCVDGDLDLQGCSRLLTLPSKLVVRGRLRLDGCIGIKMLPTSVREVFGLSAKGCASLRTIESIVECRGTVDLRGCNELEPVSTTFQALEKVQIDGCTITPTEFIIQHELRDVIIIALPGKRIRDVIESTILANHPVLNGVITNARKIGEKTYMSVDARALCRGIGD